MRLSSIFLAVIGAILLSNEVVAVPTRADRFEVSKVTSLDQVYFTQDSQPDKRFLRAHHHSNEVDEERISMAKINKLMNGDRANQFDKGIGKGYADAKIYSKLDVKSNPMYSRIVHAYQDYIKQLAPRLVSK